MDNLKRFLNVISGKEKEIVKINVDIELNGASALIYKKLLAMHKKVGSPMSLNEMIFIGGLTDISKKFVQFINKLTV